MFEKFAKFFAGSSLSRDTTGKPTDKDVQIATGVLLLEMAGADNDYAPEETQTIFKVMQKQFNLAQDDVLNLLEAGDALRRSREGIDEFIDAVCRHFDAQQKELVYTMIWQVVLADGRVDKFESRFAVQLRNRLRLTEEQAEAAKKSAERSR